MRSPRAAARTKTLRQIKDLKTMIVILQGWWTPSGTVWLDQADRKPGDNAYRRERLVHEYPEAQRRYWAGTIEHIDTMTEQLRQLREHCLAEYNATPVSGAGEAAERYRTASSDE